MALSEHQIKVISDHPLDLHSIRNKLKHINESGDLRLEDVSNLLWALLLTQAARGLEFRSGRRRTVNYQLISIVSYIEDGGGEYDLFYPLVRRIMARAPDIDIWEAVYSVIESFSAETPGATSSYLRFYGASSNNTVQQGLAAEIKNCIYRGVGGFWDKYFDSDNWPEEAKSMLRGVMTAHDGEKWNDFPSAPDEKLVWEWLYSLQERFLADAPNKLCTSEFFNQFQERRGQMDIFFQKDVSAANMDNYESVLIVGEHTTTHDATRFKADLVQLAHYVRDVFIDQPTRRYVHAFLLRASQMELWVFDRSGPYSSGPFDIHSEPYKFAQALVGYATMADDALGLDVFIEWQERCYATLENAIGNRTKIELQTLLFASRSIVCGGTTCYRTPKRYVAKFSWDLEKRNQEVDYLKLAEERGVQGVVRMVAHRQITSIADMRKGLEFPKPHRLLDEDARFMDVFGNMNTYVRTSMSILRDPSGAMKRPQPDREWSKMAEALEEQLTISQNKPSLHPARGKYPFENRIYSCLVVSPAGRAISNFKSIRQLLSALRDAILAHRSLYLDGNILHRDISMNNIIITDPKIAGGFKGMLIDLDRAIEMDADPSGPRQRIGTIPYMAIEVLREADHTYRHDLESFFYVLIDMCARSSWENGIFGDEKPPKSSLLCRWKTGSVYDMFYAKMEDISVAGLHTIMKEFPERFGIVKPLCLRIRDILFPLDKGNRMKVGTPAGDPDKLYGPMITAFDEVIVKLD